MLRSYYTSLDQSGSNKILLDLKEKESYNEEDLLAYAAICRRGYGQKVGNKHLLETFSISNKLHEMYLCYCLSNKITTPALFISIKLIGLTKAKDEMNDLRSVYAEYLDDEEFLIINEDFSIESEFDKEIIIRLVRSHSVECIKKLLPRILSDNDARAFYYETVFVYSFGLFTKDDMNREVFSLIAGRIDSIDELDFLYLSSLLDRINHVDVCSEDYRRLALCFPDQIEIDLADFSPLCRRILSIKEDVLKSYLLGFDISEIIPSKSQLFRAAKELDRLGIDKFCERICGQIDCINPTELIGLNSVSSFHPFDRILLIQNESVYCITRTMFSLVLTKDQNPYTRVKIHPIFRMKIEMKASIEMKYKLPPAAPFNEILKGF